jgi:hypothetical protein
MKYLLLLLFIFIVVSANSQNLSDLKNSTDIWIEFKNDTSLVINDSKEIKTIYKKFTAVKIFKLDEPGKWIKLSNWNTKLICSPSNMNINFYTGGFITINESAYYSSLDQIEEYIDILKELKD